jgi:hypothetical protein
MRYTILLTMASLFFLGSCQNNALTGGQNAKDLCFASVTEASNGALAGNNYHFIRLIPDNEGMVEGTFYHAPFGTDGSRGSLTGSYDEGTGTVSAQATLYAEGNRYTEDRNYMVRSDALDLGYTAPDGQTAVLPRVSCDTYNSMFQAYQRSVLDMNINRSDRTRLTQVEAFQQLNYDAENAPDLQFLERLVNLDNDWETQEYMVYVIDPSFCGTGGCNLWIVNEKGETLSEVSVVKLPVYMEISTAEESMARKGEWQNLYVWSQGMRRLSAENGTYPNNASVAPQVEETEVTLHPEKYQLLLDHLE